MRYMLRVRSLNRKTSSQRRHIGFERHTVKLMWIMIIIIIVIIILIIKIIVIILIIIIVSKI